MNLTHVLVACLATSVIISPARADSDDIQTVDRVVRQATPKLASGDGGATYLFTIAETAT
jgi:virulence-associated protein VagC